MARARLYRFLQNRNDGRWRNTKFCRTIEGLLLYAQPITPALLALPDTFLTASNRYLYRHFTCDNEVRAFQWMGSSASSL